MTWFDELTGFPEQPTADVRAKLRLKGTRSISLENGRTFEAGEFSTPTLSQLRSNLPTDNELKIRVSELIGDVRTLHQDVANKDAVFQVASQFNCLEMASPHVTPEAGVGIYENDKTQGPACSICAGAGTIFRNYFANVNGSTGQTQNNQIDCLAETGLHFENGQRKLWKMRNGYCLPTSAGLIEIENRLSNCDEAKLDEIRAKLMVGIQSDTQVTIEDSTHTVTQVFCSALPIAYSNIAPAKWDHFFTTHSRCNLRSNFSRRATKLREHRVQQALPDPRRRWRIGQQNRLDIECDCTVA